MPGMVWVLEETAESQRRLYAGYRRTYFEDRDLVKKLNRPLVPSRFPPFVTETPCIR